jgi:glyceraldehyde 3-phosphate dehydrogenase
MNGLSRHLQANGASRAVLTAPGKGEVKNIIYGVNHDTLTEDDTVLSAASCTTNAIVPPLKVMNDHFGIVGGHVETVHAYTNDQNLTDNFHKKERRGRSAPLNMVITETGAATAVVKALRNSPGNSPAMRFACRCRTSRSPSSISPSRPRRRLPTSTPCCAMRR